MVGIWTFYVVCCIAHGLGRVGAERPHPNASHEPDQLVEDCKEKSIPIACVERQVRRDKASGRKMDDKGNAAHELVGGGGQ